jgi:hypothetical protein
MPIYLVTLKETVVYKVVFTEATSKAQAFKEARDFYEAGELYRSRFKKSVDHKLEGIEVEEATHTD